MTKPPYSLLFLVILSVLVVPGMVSALTFSDNFSGYNNQYLILSDMNVPSQWATAFDGNKIIGDVNQMIRDGTINVRCDVNKNVSNACGISRTGLDQNFNLTDYNALGRMWVVFSTDDNSTVTSVEIAFGTTSNNWTFRNTNPFGWGYFEGFITVPFDLNSAVSSNGTPSMVDVNFLQPREVYGAGQVDHNILFGGIWLEKTPNAFNGNWQINLVNGTSPQGYALPFNYTNQGYGMSIANNDKQSYGYHARVFIPSLNSIDTSQYDLDISVDVNQVDTNWGTRILFDAANFAPGDNFSACFLYDASSTSRAIGIEQWQEGVRTYSQTLITLNYGDYNTLRCVVDDLAVNIYVNGVLTHSGTLNSRVDGQVGIESYLGRTNIKNYSITLTYDPTTGQIPFGGGGLTLDIFKLLLSLVFLAVVALLMLGAIHTGDPKIIVATGVVVAIVYVFYNALFF